MTSPYEKVTVIIEGKEKDGTSFKNTVTFQAPFFLNCSQKRSHKALGDLKDMVTLELKVEKEL